MHSLSEDWRIDYDELEMGDVLARGNFAEVHRYVSDLLLHPTSCQDLTEELS